MGKLFDRAFRENFIDSLFCPPGKAGTGIGAGVSDDMLEQYGVWIKVEPEIISESESRTESTVSTRGKSRKTDVAIPGDSDIGDAELPSFESEESGISFDDLEVPQEEEIEDGIEHGDDLRSELESFEEELPDVDIEELDEADNIKSDVVGEGINEDIIEEPLDLSLEGIAANEFDTEEIELDVEPENKDTEELDSFEDSSDKEFSDGMDEFSEVELGVLPEIDTGISLDELEEPEILPELKSDENAQVFEFEEDLDANDEKTGDEFMGTEEPAAFEEPLRRAAHTGEEIEVPLSNDQFSENRFDDLDHIEKELQSKETDEDDDFSAAGNQSILVTIEKELLEIKKELAQIKSELSLGKGMSAPAAGRLAPKGLDENKGFFDEEEDETIALTGDELNNILNTADITEESADELPLVEETKTVPVRKQPERLKDVSLAHKSDELRYESTPVEKIELEEAPQNGSFDDFDALPEQGLSDLSEDDFSSVEEFKITDEKPIETADIMSGDIALEDEIDMVIDEDEVKEADEEAIEEGPDTFDELIEKDLQNAEEIEMEISDEKKNEFEEASILDFETPSIRKPDDEEIVDGIDFDLPEEDGIIAEEEPPKDQEDISIPISEEEFDRSTGKSFNMEDMGIGDEGLFEEILSEGDEELPPSTGALETGVDESEVLLESLEEAPVFEEMGTIDDKSESHSPEEELLELDDADLEEMPLEADGSSLEASGVDSLDIDEFAPESDLGEALEPVAEDDLELPVEDSLLDEIPIEEPEALAEEEVPVEIDSGMSGKSITTTGQTKRASEYAILPENLKVELKSVLTYLDHLLETLPDQKIEEFAKSDYFATYKKLFEELGLAS